MDDILDTSQDITVDLVKSYLSGIAYPLDSDDITRMAQMQRAPDNIMNVINNLQTGVYDNETELDFYLDKTIRAL